MKKKEYLKRILSIVLLVVLVLSMVACGNDDKTTDSKNSISDVKDSSKDTKQQEDPVEIRIFSQYTVEEETDVSRFLLEQMEQELNIKVIRDEVSASAYNEKLQLAMSDGDYPDVFIFNNHQDVLLQSAVKDGIIVPINQYLEKGDYPNLQEYTYEGAWEAARIMNDDNIYLLPRSTVSRADGYCIRKDWLDKIGFKITSDNGAVSKDEFLTIMKGFKESDPDGDGEDNTYGLVLKPDGSGNLATIADGAFNCIGWQDSNEEYSYMNPAYEIGNQNYKDLLKYNQEIYKYTHPDSIILTGDEYQYFYSGQCGAVSGFAGHMTNRMLDLKKVNPEGSCTYLSGVVNDDGVLQGAAIYPGIWGGLAITKNCKNPEKILEMVNWLLSDKAWEYVLWGKPDVTYEKDANGKCSIIDADTYKEAKLASWATRVARRKEDVNFFLDLSLKEEELSEVRGWLDVAVKSVRFSKEYGKIPAIATDLEFVEAENKRKETITKIIMGALSVDEYDVVLQNWYDKGGKTYVEQMNEIIASMDK